MFKVKFWVSDECNFRCGNCHWFSTEIKHISPPPPIDYINYINKNALNICEIVFTGGEPTLWNGLADVINNSPEKIRKVINTNGSFPESLFAIKTKVTILASLHKQTDWDAIKRLIGLSNERGWGLGFAQFTGSLPELPGWFKARIYTEDEQVEAGAKLEYLVGKEIYCKPRMIYIATDGNAYVCERGLRSKDEKFSAGFGLTWGETNIKFCKCNVDKNCLSCLVTEQEFKGASSRG